MFNQVLIFGTVVEVYDVGFRVSFATKDGTYQIAKIHNCDSEQLGLLIGDKVGVMCSMTTNGSLVKLHAENVKIMNSGVDRDES